VRISVRTSSIVALLLSVFLLGTPALAKDATVGDFLMGIAKARQLSASDPVSARAALQSSGVVLPPLALDRALTEGDVVQIGGAVGLRVTTTQPAAAFDSGQVEAFLSVFAPKLVPLSGTDPQDTAEDAFPNPGTGKGNGKKKGHHKSPTDPT
jgi:hypothetical protein